MTVAPPTSPNIESPSPGHGVSWRAALRVWTRIGLESFGGPAGQIAVMHRILVEEGRWISETRFLHALNYCMLPPGPEAMQLATYVGWLMHRTLGGLIAGTLFVLPGFISILTLSLLYAGYRNLAFVEGLFFGLKPAVLAVVAQAVFSGTPTHESTCRMICEAKGMGRGLQDDVHQARRYCRDLGLNACRRLLVADGGRFYLYDRNGDGWPDQPTGYMNVLKLRTSHVCPAGTSAVDTLMRLTPMQIGQ